MLYRTDHFTSELQKLSDPAKAEWWNRYLRNSIKFIGVPIPEIRKLLKKNKDLIGKGNEIYTIADELLGFDIAEQKLAGILIYQLFILPEREYGKIIDHLEVHYDKHRIYDWNTCDWLCVRILSPIIDHGVHGEQRRILEWHTEPYLWKARSALVAFTQAKTLKCYLDELSVPLKQMIMREERFAKTAVGWLLREISRINQDYVRSFVKRHEEYITTEVSKNALKYINK